MALTPGSRLGVYDVAAQIGEGGMGHVYRATDQLRVAPGRQLVAFERNESDQGEVYVATFPEFLQQARLSQNGGAQPIWRSDGRELFYLTLEGVLHSVEIAAGQTSPSTRSRPLFRTPLLPTLGLDEYSTTDGRFLFIEKKGQQITILMNWLEDRAGK